MCYVFGSPDLTSTKNAVFLKYIQDNIKSVNWLERIR